MQKVLIIGDSSALPREEICFDKTYYAQLKANNIIIESSAVANNNSYKINCNLEAFMHYGYNANVVILNYGIVDVYPRPYPNKIYRLLACVGLLHYVDKFLKKTKLYYRLGDFFNFKEVNFNQFNKYTESIVQKLLDKDIKKILIIGILKPSKVLLNSKNVNKEVILYNSVFKELSYKYQEVHYIDIYSDSNEDFSIWDGYHYSEIAFNYLSKKIEKLIIND